MGVRVMGGVVVVVVAVVAVADGLTRHDCDGGRRGEDDDG